MPATAITPMPPLNFTNVSSAIAEAGQATGQRFKFVREMLEDPHVDP